jgi:4-carboxymuconolactone decarboxylase
MSSGVLSPETSLLVRLSGALAAGERGALRGALVAARDPSHAEAVEEAILQSYLFVGFPTTLNAFHLWREVSGQGAPSPRQEAREDWMDRGVAVCRAVYGSQYERVRRNVAALHPDLGEWMIEEGYGKVLGRDGLDLLNRELCIVALLAVSNAPEQLHSHLRGALAAGASPEAVSAVLDEVDGLQTVGARKAARDRWREVQARWRERTGEGPIGNSGLEGNDGR